jgi:cysteine desulfurase
MQAIYCDYCATTPVDERVVTAMLPYFTEFFGNAASRAHKQGQQAAVAVEHAREQCASAIGCRPADIIWLSGATEANNLAIKGTAAQYEAKHGCPGHIVTQATEHKAVLDPVRSLEEKGWRVTILPVSDSGLLVAEDVAAAIAEDTALVSIMSVNNELGVIMPIEAIGAVCQSRGVPFHSDASQSVGKVPVSVRNSLVDLLSVSAHKFYGPKGIGALAIRRSAKGVRPLALQEGGGHERGFRSGTLNVPGIVGMGVACELASGALEAESSRIRHLRDCFESLLVHEVPDVVVHSVAATRVGHVSNLAFLGVDSECLLMQLENVAASTGSACTSWAIEPSHVLTALGLSEDEKTSSVRFSFGRFTTGDEIQAAASAIRDVVFNLRAVGRRA